MSALRFANPFSLLRSLWVRLLPQQEPAVALEERIARLEAEVATLKRQEVRDSPWWESVAGTFADDAVFDKAMALGVEYRRSDEQVAEAIEP